MRVVSVDEIQVKSAMKAKNRFLFFFIPFEHFPQNNNLVGF